MSEVNTKIHFDNNHPSYNEGVEIIIQRQPIMECALDVLTRLANSGSVILKAKGEDIPTAVGVANVVTEKMMKNNSKIVKITVDSESGVGKYGETLISTIRIILSKN